MKTKFQSITANLMVEDVDESVSYYEKVLGFKLEISVPKDNGKLQWAMVSRDSVDIMLHERANIIEEMPELEGTEPGGGSITLYVKMEGIDNFYEEVRMRNDTEIIKEPNTTFYGMNEFILRDINGYIITFAEPVEQ
jgi:uncharacterized glyoxalase superfamily protein PhnB